MFVFEGFSVEAARRFADAWLPAWTGNEPERLLEFYADDTFYSWARGERGFQKRGWALGIIYNNGDIDAPSRPPSSGVLRCELKRGKASAGDENENHRTPHRANYLHS